MDYKALAARCPTCESPLKICIELIEYLIQCEKEMDKEFDDQIIEITRGNGKPKIIPPTAPFPVALDLDDNGIVFIGYCLHCKSARMAGLSLNDLKRLLRDEKGDANEDS